MSASYTYTENVNTNLICCICRAPFVDPVTTTTCAHTFCLECIHTALSISSQCPVDRSRLTVHDLRGANPLLRNLVDELVVECPNRQSGCNETSQRQLVGIHVRDSCPYTKVPCSHPNCNQRVYRKDARLHSETCPAQGILACPDCKVDCLANELEAHRRLCALEEVTCNACGVIMIRAELAPHTDICPLVAVPCEQAANGCPWSGARHHLLDHVSTCPYEAIKGFFATHTVKVASLEDENAALRRQVGELEGQLRCVAADVHATRVSLGPWFRSDASTSSAASPVVSPNTSTAATVSSPVSLASDLAPSPPPRPDGARRISALNAALLGVSSDAPYVPPDAEPAFEYDHHRALPAPTININTSLEGALTSLRNSVVALAGSLDSSSRRHDVTLMTETLRMHEEVQSLRAIVHGLRMQVHQLMMERSQMGLYAARSGAAGAGDGGPWSTRAEYLNEQSSTGPPMMVPLTTTVRRTTENKL
ncbi:hypothetical protein AURDEDRAFT_93212 [Auricularia subglabra TFB-10046 SS5]|uniref:RING-type domain-containing protein n=1 Tax=Auricularia subglabra (strain TFB-10046 / SS5) TaxID=717982 RepID=J0LEM4_AURST|nr:hypothetical protein AURDEDRAFT_93212 [Auricularia subglabra TFB-10046 SS5]